MKTASEILDDLWECAYSGGLRETRKKLDIDHALKGLVALLQAEKKEELTVYSDKQDKISYLVSECNKHGVLGCNQVIDKITKMFNVGN